MWNHVKLSCLLVLTVQDGATGLLTVAELNQNSTTGAVTFNWEYMYSKWNLFNISMAMLPLVMATSVFSFHTTNLPPPFRLPFAAPVVGMAVPVNIAIVKYTAGANPSNGQVIYTIANVPGGIPPQSDVSSGGTKCLFLLFSAYHN